MYIDLSTCDGLITTIEEMVSSCAKIQHLLDNMTLILNSNSPYTATTSVIDDAMVTSVAASGGTVVCTICNIFLEELYLIHQTATVDEFHQQFEALRTRISIKHLELPEEFFISGLRKDVQSYHPCTMLDAYHVACIHEYNFPWLLQLIMLILMLVLTLWRLSLWCKLSLWLSINPIRRGMNVFLWYLSLRLQ